VLQNVFITDGNILSGTWLCSFRKSDFEYYYEGDMDIKDYKMEL